MRFTHMKASIDKPAMPIAQVRSIRPPSPPIKLSKIGKDVAMGPPSSTDTGLCAPKPMIRNDIAMR